MMQGPGKGLKWIVGSGTHGMWLGSYEAEKQKLLPGLISEGDTVLDIGAHAGFFSLIFSRLVGETGHVIAFEPFPLNLDFLDRHIRLNGLKNIQVYKTAVGEQSGKGRFKTGKSSSQGGMSDTGDLDIEIINLDSLGPFATPVKLVKIDVEGAEDEVLKVSRVG